MASIVGHVADIIDDIKQCLSLGIFQVTGPFFTASPFEPLID